MNWTATASSSYSQISPFTIQRLITLDSFHVLQPEDDSDENWIWDALMLWGSRPLTKHVCQFNIDWSHTITIEPNLVVVAGRILANVVRINWSNCNKKIHESVSSYRFNRVFIPFARPRKYRDYYLSKKKWFRHEGPYRRQWKWWLLNVKP